MFYLFILIIFFISFVIFFFLNITFLIKKFNQVKESFFANSGHFSEQLIYFLGTEKNLYSLNAIFALIFGTFGFCVRLGFVGFILGAVAGWLFPAALLQLYQRKRLQKINTQLIDFINHIGSAMRAGQTLVQAIQSSNKMLAHPISQEANIIIRQIRMGVSVQDALNAFSVRVPLDDVKLALTSIIISLRTGADLPQMLKKISDAMRERLSIRGKINVLTAQGKIEGFIVGLIPIVLALFLYWRDPDYMSPLLNTFIGNCLIGAMVAMEIIAFFVIRKMVSIKI